ncbi:YlqD family protein [Aciduricibacillus chroicocephali]|uniref:YlqD family protein n=1 Tax=Aciduricibacillus chroicocephali TaxID=3054939 RepID=A0ABY9KY07_9BACI|nr:YlqD family protein [Bacillaceae bacterium 44XB]
MNIMKKVLIKQVVTEHSKAAMRKKFINHKLQLEQECQQLRFEQRKLENKPGLSKKEIARRFQSEIGRRQDEIRITEFKTEQLDILPDGMEMIEREVEALVEVSPGMQWDELMEPGAIVVKDGIVIRVESGR